MAESTQTLTLLCGPTFDSKTVSVWGQLSFSGSDWYNTGGVRMGLTAFANALTIDTASGQFLQCEIWGEDTEFTASFEQGGYVYHYAYPADTVQISTPAGVELTDSALLPAAVLNDVKNNLALSASNGR